MTARLREALATMPVVVLTGMRQVGKSTLLEHEAHVSGRRVVTLDDFAQLEAARRDPDGFVGGDVPLAIDEAQRCPELLLAIKRRVDRERRPGQFLLSGSANFALLSTVTESLAGRALWLVLWPFTRREVGATTATEPFLLGFFRRPRVDRAADARRPLAASEVLAGGLPPVALGDAPRPTLWLRGYEQTYLERDVRALAQVADLIAFRRLLQLAATRTGQVLNASALAREAQLSAATAVRYLGVLETSYALWRLAPYLRSRTSRLVKSAKVYLTDAGLACHLNGIASAEVLSEDPLRGAVYETYVAQNLAGLLEARWPEARLAFWHVQGRHEVDFVIEAERECLAIEVKAGARWADGDLAGLRAFLATTPRCRAAVLAYNGTAAVRLGERLFAVPLATLLA
jgi:hypothetical protein